MRHPIDYCISCVLALLFAGCAANPLLPSELRLSGAELTQKLERRFPVQGSVAGLVDVTLTRPLVSLNADRVVTSFDVTVQVPVSGKVLNGKFVLSGVPRYESQTRALFLKEAKVERLAIDSMPDALSGALAKLASQLARANFEEKPFHVFKPDDFTRFGVGLEPQWVEVRGDALVLIVRR